MTDEMKALLTIVRHREIMEGCLDQLAGELRARALRHDRTKLTFQQFDGFVRINQVARQFPYGSPEYKRSLAEENAASGCIGQHYAAESHHPEHHESPAADMTFLDIIEMVFDWVAAAEAYSTGEGEIVLKLDQQVRRYGHILSDRQWWLIGQVVDWLVTQMPNLTVTRMTENPPTS